MEAQPKEGNEGGHVSLEKKIVMMMTRNLI
jgi:hypothetical protein